MGRYRDDLSERKVRHDLIKGMSLRDAAVKYRCSVSLIRKIRDDKRANQNISLEQTCVCCGQRAKGKGMRFLCDACFKGKAEPDVNTGEHTNHYRLPEGGWDDLLT